jgi:hypothetical protein
MMGRSFFMLSHQQGYRQKRLNRSVKHEPTQARECHQALRINSRGSPFGGPFSFQKGQYE